MSLFVMRLAKPNNIKRPVIVWVVSQRTDSTNPAGLPNQLASEKRICNAALRTHPVGIFLAPLQHLLDIVFYAVKF